MELFSVLAIGVLSIATIIYVFFMLRFSYWQRRGIPFEPPSFPYGNFQGVGQKRHFSKVVKNIYDNWKGKDKVVGMYFSYNPNLLILDHQLVKNILIKDFNNFVERGLYYNEKDDPLSAHLFSLEGDKWRELRSKLSPTFTSGKMKFMFPIIVEVADRFRECLGSMVDDGSEIIEIRDMLSRFTTDVIGTCAFGIECNSLKDPEAEFREMGKAAIDKPRHSFLFISLISSCRSLARFFRIKMLPDDQSAFYLKVVNETIEYREKNNIHRNDFMDILIKLKNSEDNKLSVNEIAAQSFLFFVAGFETSSTTLGFAMYELAQNRQIQEKARKQIRDVLKKHNDQFTYEAMKEMTYVDQIIKETLRKYPPVSSLTRKTLEDYKVPGTQHVIEKGTTVWIPAHAIQHDPEYYPEPDQFRPERFSADQVAEREDTKWLPFGEGPRNCIGSRFGMMQTRIGLSTVLNSFDLTMSEKTSIPFEFEPKNFILCPKGGIYIKFRRNEL